MYVCDYLKIRPDKTSLIGREEPFSVNNYKKLFNFECNVNGKDRSLRSACCDLMAAYNWVAGLV